MNIDFEKEALLQIVGRLLQIVTQVGSMVEEASEKVELEPLQSMNGSEAEHEAIRVRNERIQLIAAWEKLESEQRKFVLQSGDATNPKRNASCVSNNTTHASGVPTIAVTSQIPVDRLAQFEMLRSEYDRIRGLESSWE